MCLTLSDYNQAVSELHWGYVSLNPNLIHLLEANPDKIDWDNLSMNPAAIHLLEANLDKIDWGSLSWNPNAIHLLEANPDKINWMWISMNPNAMHLLEANQDKIHWDILLTNPSLSLYDYELIRKTNSVINEEIHQYVYHPRFIERYIQKYGVEALDEYMA